MTEMDSEFFQSLELLMKLHEKYIDDTDEDEEGEQIREDLGDLWIPLGENSRLVLRKLSEALFGVEGKYGSVKEGEYRAILKVREEITDDDYAPLEGYEVIVDEMENFLDSIWYGMTQEEIEQFNQTEE